MVILNRGKRTYTTSFGPIAPDGRPVAVPSDEKSQAEAKKLLKHHAADLTDAAETLKETAGTVAHAQAAELAELRDQVAKLQLLVQQGDAGDLAKELEAANRDLQAQLEAAQAKADKAAEDAKALFDQVTNLTNEKAQLETALSETKQQLEAALKNPKAPRR